MMKTILVTGANGQVGSELQYLVSHYTAFTFVFTDMDEMDITDPKSIDEVFRQINPDFVINAAAYTAVDRAEEHPDIALAVNVVGPRLLLEACQKYAAHLIHISTDYVYHGSNNQPFGEHTTENPQSVYALTKLMGDQVLLDQTLADAHALVIRTSWVYSSYGHNFVKTMIKLGRERDALSIVYDQIGTPTYARDLANAILAIISQLAVDPELQKATAGLYHYSNEGVASWYDFAQAIFELENLAVKVKPILTEAYPTPAQRPHFSLLHKEKIKNTFNINIPYWRTSLKDCLSVINKTRNS